MELSVEVLVADLAVLCIFDSVVVKPRVSQFKILFRGESLGSLAADSVGREIASRFLRVSLRLGS